MRTRIALTAATAAALITVMTTTSVTLATTTSGDGAQPATGALAAFHRGASSPRTNGGQTSEVGSVHRTKGLGSQIASVLGSPTIRDSIVGWTTSVDGTPGPATAGATASAPPAAPIPAVTPPPPPPISDATSTDTADWQCIRIHESGDEYNNPARPSGAYGILLVTWRSFGMAGWPYEAEPAVQDAIALELYHRYGWVPWGTRFVCGL
jgi:Transglycosylase-like domain